MINCSLRHGFFSDLLNMRMLRNLPLEKTGSVDPDLIIIKKKL